MYLVWVIAAIVLTMAIDQLWTRLHPVSKRLYLPSPRLGWTLRPNLRRTIDLRRNGEVIWTHDIAINSHGFNDREWGGKNPQIRRVLMIGDSIVESRQVLRERNFVSMAEAALKRDGIGYEIFNVGVAGWSVDSALNYFDQVGRSLAPDVVILGLFVGNDLVEGDYETFRFLFANAWDCRRYDKPAHSLRGDKIVRTNFPAWKNVVARWLSVDAYEHSRLFRRLYQRLNRIAEKRRNGSNLLRARGVSYNMHMEQTKGNEFFYRQAAAQVDALANACRSVGCGFGVMLVPNFALFYPMAPDADPASRASHEYARDLAHYVEMRNRLTAKYPLTSLLEPFQSANRQITFKPADPHLNHAGHELVAEHLVSLIRTVEQSHGV